MTGGRDRAIGRTGRARIYKGDPAGTIGEGRRRGKYVGGAPILGYDIDREKSRLVVNEREAARVRQIFELYLEHQSLLQTIAELDRRDWAAKRWTTKKGKQRGGRPFNKNGLYNLLTNVTYLGKIRYKDETFEGEHAGIVDPDVFAQVQNLLQLNRRTGGKSVRNRYGAMLKGLLHCTACRCSMTHTLSTKNGAKRYRYYVCVNAQKRGWHNCPTKSIPAVEIERFVVEQIKAIGHDPGLVAETLVAARKQTDEALTKLDSEERGLQKDLRSANDEMSALAVSGTSAGDGPEAIRLADLHERVRLGERRLTEIREEGYRLRSELVSEADIAQALREFDPLWTSLSLKEQARVLELLIERIEFDGTDGTVSVSFRPTGIKSLCDEFALEETAA